MILEFEFSWWIYLILFWTLIWKGIGAWKAARNNQLPWFVLFFIVNTLGILPMIYLIWFQQKLPERVLKKSVRKKIIKKSKEVRKFPSLV